MQSKNRRVPLIKQRWTDFLLQHDGAIFVGCLGGIQMVTSHVADILQPQQSRCAIFKKKRWSVLKGVLGNANRCVTIKQWSKRATNRPPTLSIRIHKEGRFRRGIGAIGVGSTNRITALLGCIRADKSNCPLLEASTRSHPEKRDWWQSFRRIWRASTLASLYILMYSHDYPLRRAWKM